MADRLLPRRGATVVSAQTEKLGFLNLPNQVRYRIYELAIYDHDRGAVFLLRALPRKVTPAVDVDTIDLVDNDIVDPANYVFEVVNLHDDTRAGGHRIDNDEGGKSSDAEYDSIVHESSEIVGSEGYSHVNAADLPSGDQDLQVLSDQSESDCLDCECLTCSRCLGIRSFDHDDCMCECHKDVHYDSDSRKDGWTDHDRQNICVCIYPDWMHNSSPERGRVDEIVALATDTPGECDGFYCYDKHCEYYTSDDSYSDRTNDAYVKDGQLWLADGAEKEEDDEHYDAEETIGMLYEPLEPEILLACREIREQCLPLYYALNSFSWRFFWRDYARFLTYFTQWATSIQDNQAALVKRVSFESRHQCAEGIEFEADIDILKYRPFFEVRVSAGHPVDVEVEAIVTELERTLVWGLWKMSHGGVAKIILSTDRLVTMAATFIKAMQSELGEIVNHPGALRFECGIVQVKRAPSPVL